MWICVGSAPMISSSYVELRPWECYTNYVPLMCKKGCLAKQSKEHHNVWKDRWIVMQDSVLYIFKSKEAEPVLSSSIEAATEMKARCNSCIPLDTVTSVTTAVSSPYIL